VAEGSSVSIVPSRDGVGPDVAALARDLTAELADPTGARAVELRTKVTSPSLTTTQARDMGIRERISTFSTAYSGGTAARLNNIRVLAQSLNGELVGPGDTFSLNDAVGERTASKGYQEANAIVRGKLVTQIGGGICQVATTLFNAVFLSGLPIAERVNHSFFISHYPMGRDATVSWGGPDLRWKNTTSKWVLVSATLSGDSIAVSLYGTSPGYDVSYSTVPFTNSVPFKTVKVKDPLQPVGTQTVFQPGENGGKTVVTRVVKKNGAVVRTNTFTSEYTPVDETVAVGSKAVAAKSPVPVGSIKKR
jgi:vancomycin resistance protein YoaR